MNNDMNANVILFYTLKCQTANISLFFAPSIKVVPKKATAGLSYGFNYFSWALGGSRVLVERMLWYVLAGGWSVPWEGWEGSYTMIVIMYVYKSMGIMYLLYDLCLQADQATHQNHDLPKPDRRKTLKHPLHRDWYYSILNHSSKVTLHCTDGWNMADLNSGLSWHSTSTVSTGSTLEQHQTPIV